MARADLLVNLVRAAASGDKAGLRRVVESMAAEERAKRHDGLADRLIKALNGASSFALFSAQPNHAPAQTTGKDFVVQREPTASLATLVLQDHIIQNISEIIEENYRADLLRSYGLQPRHRVLLSGPPGNGKTTIAEGIAEALGRPLLTVRYDSLIGSYLGETNQRLKQLFDYVRNIPCVLLFDEFDAIGKERGDKQETGEIKRVVSSLLLEIDQLPSYVMIIAATNHHELLDRAVWRRFQARIELESPTVEQLREYFLRTFDVPTSQWAAALREIERLDLPSYAEAADFALDVKRSIVLSNGATLVSDAIRDRANQWSRRMRVPTSGDRSDEASAEVRHPSAHRAR
jgi:SpoVK/Ycf46/Vps4 family AAA+-type ATPase